VRGPPTISTPAVVPATPAAGLETTGAVPAPSSSATAATSALRERRRLS